MINEQVAREKAGAAAGAGAGTSSGSSKTGAGSSSSPKDDNVIDAEFEVKDAK